MLTRTKQFATSIILLTTILLSTMTVAAQGSVSDWSRLNSVAAGTKLSVKLKNGKTVDGKLSSVSDSALSLTVKNAPLELKREEVLTIHEVIKKSATKATLIGLGIGAGAGAALGVAADASKNDGSFETIDNAVAAGVTVLGAGVGALAGFFIGRSGNKRVLIFEAK
jgi:small nuclear ribonucleoprotein (snRNP)-like protein